MQYFKHQSNMRHDIKLKRVISRYGLEGYGLYNLILESITGSLSTDSPIPDLSETCEDIAEFYNGNTARINEIANYMVNQGLFDLDDITGHVICTKLYKFLDTSQTRSAAIRDMITSYKASVNKQLSDQSRPSQPVSDKSDRTETEQKQNRTEEETETEGVPYSKIIQKLNNICDTKYRASSNKTKGLIKARFNEGFTRDDFYTVIEKKANEWIGTDMSKFLRPETLFGTKFEGYLNQKEFNKKKSQYNMGTGRDIEGFC